MAETIARGYEAIAGIGAESVVGTAVAATQRLAMISEALSAPYEEIEDASLAGTPAPRPAANGAQRPQGTILGNLEYVAGNLILQHFLGAYTAATTPYYEFLDSLEGKSLTLALAKQLPATQVWEYQGVKFSQLVLSGSPTDGVRWEATIMGTARVFAASPNSPAGLAALGKAGDRILYHHLTLVADENLTSAPTTEYKPADFSLSSNRNMDAPLVNQIAPLEALENGYRDSVLTLTFPRYSTSLHQFVTWEQAGTRFQLALTFTDGSSTLKLEAPLCKVRSANPQIGGPELPTVPVEIVLYNNADGDNTYLSSVAEELYVTE